MIECSRMNVCQIQNSMGQPVVFIGTYLIHVFVKSTFYAFAVVEKTLYKSARNTIIVSNGSKLLTKVISRRQGRR